MRIIWFTVALLVAGCVVPVPIPGPCVDSGCEDASVRPSCHGVVTPAWHPSPQPVGTAVLAFEGCGSAPVTVVASDGTNLPVSVGVVDGNTSISFQTTRPGIYSVNFDSSGAVRTTQVDIYEYQDLDAGFLRTYVDRVDYCGLLTLEGRLICGRAGPEIWVYETDGGIYGHFPGDDPIVSGNVVWTLGNGGVERRVDGPAGLQLESSLADPRLMNINSAPWGASTPTSTLRGGSGNLIEFSWDGGVLTNRSWLILGSTSVFVEGEQIWDGRMCTLTPGCQTILCEPLRACPFGADKAVIAVTPDKIWFTNQGPGPHVLSAHSRPLLPSSTLESGRPVPLAQGSSSWFDPNRSGVAFWMSDEPFSAPVVLVEPPDAGTYFRVLTEPLLANTERWIVTSVSPTTIRVTPHR